MLSLLLFAAAMTAPQVAPKVDPAPMIVAPPAPPAPRIGSGVPAKPRGAMPTMTNIAEVFTADSYPADALRDGVEGTSRVAISVDARGRPTACAIRSSSGSASLDAAACRLIMARGKFNPARDPRKRAVAGEALLPIRWRVETVEAPTELTDFSVRLNYALIAGVPSGSCRGELSPVGDIATLCDESRATALNIANDIPEKDRAGVSELVMIMESRQGSAVAPPALMGIPGLVILDDRHFALTINAAGKVIQCNGGGSTLAQAGGAAPFCARFQEQKYAPSASGGPRTVIFRSQIYARK